VTAPRSERQISGGPEGRPNSKSRERSPRQALTCGQSAEIRATVAAIQSFAVEEIPLDETRVSIEADAL
jgi:hypothetical protein